MSLSISIKSPLLSVTTVRAMICAPSDKIQTMIEDGSLLWAFDIRHPNAVRPYIRVLTQSVVDYLAQKPLARRDSNWCSVLPTILPVHRDSLPATVVAHLLNCDADHVNLLVKARSFTQATARKSPNQSQKIKRESIAAFLKQRRML
ncbi:MAG: hypothetical protein ABIR24_11290 [Verrucomicrobiota bacterium]